MKREYEIKREPIVKDGKTIVKYNVYYYHDDVMVLPMFHSYDGINGTILEGYKDKNAPNWNGLTQTLKGSSLMLFAIGNAHANGFSLLLKTLTDGEAGSASQEFLIMAIGACFPTGWPHQLSNEQKAELNGYLTANKFSIQVN